MMTFTEKPAVGKTAQDSYKLYIDPDTYLLQGYEYIIGFGPMLDLMDVPDEAPIVKLVHAAARSLGIKVQTLATGGGCDANILNKRGLEVANLSTGMRDIHTVKEWLDLNDLTTSAQMVLEILRLNAVKQ